MSRNDGCTRTTASATAAATTAAIAAAATEDSTFATATATTSVHRRSDFHRFQVGKEDIEKNGVKVFSKVLHITILRVARHLGVTHYYFVQCVEVFAKVPFCTLL